MQNLAPIALFVYNRPKHAERTVKFLKQNELAEESVLFIFADGAKNDEDRAKVNEVRKYIKTINGFKCIEITESEQNQGLANAIITGVTKLVETYGKVIVFEDDLISSPFTLRYFNEALNRYQDEEKVMHIGAYMYPLREHLVQTFFFRAATSWGWATWNRAWQYFNPDIDNLISKFDKAKKNAFSIEGTMNFWKQMEEFKLGKNNSWAIRWYASVFLKKGLTLNPSQSLINNIGHDGSGIHSGLSDIYDVIINPKPITEFPERIEENRQAYLAIKTFLANRKGNLWKRIKRFIMHKFILVKGQFL